MSYTYLITGATSDVGRALIERLLTAAPDATVLAQGCGDLEKLAAFARGEVYIQDAGARLAVMAADPKPGMRVR